MGHRTQRFLIPSLTGAIALGLHLALRDFAYDDAYIHFRIAENFAQHGVPYYHVSERLMATSSLVWTLVLGAVAWIGFSLPFFVSALNGVLTTAGAWVWAHLFSRLLGRKQTGQLIPILVGLGYFAMLIRSSTGLMETPLAMLLLGLGLSRLVRGRMSGWIFMALAMFTRLELSVFVPVALVALLPARFNRVLSGALYFLLPAGVLLLTAVYFFHSPLPQTMAAKQAVWPMNASMVLSDLRNSLLGRYSGPIMSPLLLIPSWGLCLLSATVLLSLYWWVGGPVFRPTRRRRWIYAIGAGGILIMAAYVWRGVLIFDWYVPLYGVPLIVLVLGLGSMGSEGLRTTAPYALLPPFVDLAYYALGALGLTAIIPTVDQAARVQRYLEVGQILRQEFGGSHRLLTSEVGGLGYAFRGPLVDGVGLITPEAIAYHPLPPSKSRIGAIPEQFAAQQNAELLVSYPLFLQDMTGKSTLKEYRRIELEAFSPEWRVRSGSRAIWGSGKLFVLVRKDIATSATMDRLERAFQLKPSRRTKSRPAH